MLRYFMLGEQWYLGTKLEVEEASSFLEVCWRLEGKKLSSTDSCLSANQNA